MDTIWIFRCHSHLTDNWLRSIIPDHQIRSLQNTNPKVGINWCEQLGILLNCVEYICLSSQQDHKYPFRVLYCFKIICLGMTVVAFRLSTNCSAMEGILVVSCAFVNLLIPAYPFTTLTAALQVNAGLEKWCNLFANLRQRGWRLLRGLLRQWSWKLFHFYHLHPHFNAAKQRPNRKALDGRGLQTLLRIVESARTLKSKHTNNVGYNISVLHLQLCWPYLKLRNVPSMYIRSFVLQVSVRS